MEAMDAGRLELYDLLRPKLDEEPARRLVAALPAEPDRLLRGHDFELGLDRALARLETRLTWRMITIMGAWSVIVSSGWAVALRALG